MQFSSRILELAREAEVALAPIFARVDEISFENTKKIMDAFREHRVSEPLFAARFRYL